MRIREWRKLPVSLAELCLDTTLRCGQSFRWKKIEDEEWYVAELLKFHRKTDYCRACVLNGRMLFLKQDSTHLHYCVQWPTANPMPLTSKPLCQPFIDDDTESLIRNYFNLTPNLTQLYEMWSRTDSNFKRRAPKFTGVRILKQDAWEALVGFICSSNNNIARISQMVGIDLNVH
jgi:N-glycosylase/DNA lyase